MALPVLKGPFTVETFQRLAELGVLREDARVELIGGQVVEMTPIGDRHAACVRRLNRLLIPELWLVDLAEDQIFAYREPVRGQWTTTTPVPRGDRVGLLAFPDVRLFTHDILG